MKFYLNSQRMSDSFYHINESSELNEKNERPKHTHMAMFWNFCIGRCNGVNLRTVRSMAS